MKLIDWLLVNYYLVDMQCGWFVQQLLQPEADFFGFLLSSNLFQVSSLVFTRRPKCPHQNPSQRWEGCTTNCFKSHHINIISTEYPGHKQRQLCPAHNLTKLMDNWSRTDKKKFFFCSWKRGSLLISQQGSGFVWGPCVWSTAGPYHYRWFLLLSWCLEPPGVRMGTSPARYLTRMLVTEWKLPDHRLHVWREALFCGTRTKTLTCFEHELVLSRAEIIKSCTYQIILLYRQIIFMHKSLARKLYHSSCGYCRPDVLTGPNGWKTFVRAYSHPVSHIASCALALQSYQSKHYWLTAI